MSEKKEYSPLTDSNRVIAILNKISIFGGLSEKQLAEVFRLLKKASYKCEEFVYQQGEPAGHIYIIEKGEIKIIVGNENESYELVTFSEGDCFGETSVIGIQPHCASALAMVDTDLIILERSSLLSIFESDKELFGMLILNIARETSRRLHKSDDILAHYLLKK
ncbi:MAG TPA: cyclic nucleotide-binding domain-containing protein [Candidatus Omnitrophota bacterium]|nr:cyclic nucleotide-binding domain-containing protein [Candidatus Omnitrophota bacterium]